MDDVQPIKYVECPRDAWQGLKHFVPTETKITYLNALLNAGFTHLDLGSFVSPKAVPQMQDTEEVLSGLPDPAGRDYLCIVANQKGMERAMLQPKVTSVGFPLSISETFQKRNANQSLQEAWALVEHLKEQAATVHKNLVVYLSMGFGNPYGDPWSPDMIRDALLRLRDLGVDQVALADTVGTATPQQVEHVCRFLESGLYSHAPGLHLHARPEQALALVQAGLRSGIRWFEGAIGGFGGCPFAKDELVGNLPTEQIMGVLRPEFHLNQEILRLSQSIFCDP